VLNVLQVEDGAHVALPLCDKQGLPCSIPQCHQGAQHCSSTTNKVSRQPAAGREGDTLVKLQIETGPDQISQHVHAWSGLRCCALLGQMLYAAHVLFVV
jgi:hypothetical protein